ncbi:MAG: PAS domain-containing sensor histidine kinase, partial [Pseudomonas alloputida]
MDDTAYPLLTKDPQPSLLLASDASPLALNPALQAWVAEGPELARWLPANCAALVRACLRQHRAISDVEVQVGERIVLWTFMPDNQGQ